MGKQKSKFKRGAGLNTTMRSRRRQTLGIGVCFGMLGLLGVAFLCPACNNNVSAEGEVTDGVIMPMSLNVSPTISVSLADFPGLNITPTTSGATGAGTTTLRVVTTSSTGYQIFMRTADGKASLQNGSGGVVNAVSGTPTLANFGSNTWGYALGKGINANTVSYKAVPTNTNSAIMSVDSSGTNVANDTYTLAFGAKINTNIPSGEYRNNVIISAIAKPETITMQHATSMQDMTKDICAATPENYEKQLMDERDGNYYFVMKMKDGNCWMTQNLALDLDGTKTYSGGQTDSGVPIAYTNGTMKYWKGSGTIGDGTTENTAPVKTETSIPAAVSKGGAINNTRSWNLGKYVFGDPSSSTTCSDISSGGSLSSCNHFINVSGSEWNKNGQMFTTPSDASITYNATAKTYDPHYLIGNYYQYNTATGGTGAKVSGDGDDAEASICPTGNGSNWVLPLSGTANDSVSGSFYNLLSKYNAANNNATSSANIVKLPLTYTREGVIWMSAGQVIATNSNGYYWSRVAYSDRNAYSLTLGTSYVLPSGVNYSDGRAMGFPVRCLFLGS